MHVLRLCFVHMDLGPKLQSRIQVGQSCSKTADSTHCAALQLCSAQQGAVSIGPMSRKLFESGCSRSMHRRASSLNIQSRRQQLQKQRHYRLTTPIGLRALAQQLQDHRHRNTMP